MLACCVAGACFYLEASAAIGDFDALLGGWAIFLHFLGVIFAPFFCGRFGIKTAKIGPRGRWDCRTERAGGHNVRFGVLLF